MLVYWEPTALKTLKRFKNNLAIKRQLYCPISHDDFMLDIGRRGIAFTHGCVLHIILLLNSSSKLFYLTCRNFVPFGKFTPTNQ